MTSVRDRLAYRFERTLNSRFLNDPSVYHDDRRSTDEWWILAVKNAINPERLKTRARYGQLRGVPKRFSVALPAGAPPADLDLGEVNRLRAQFARDGVVQLPGDRREVVSRIAERYGA